MSFHNFLHTGIVVDEDLVVSYILKQVGGCLPTGLYTGGGGGGGGGRGGGGQGGQTFSVTLRITDFWPWSGFGNFDLLLLLARAWQGRGQGRAGRAGAGQGGQTFSVTLTITNFWPRSGFGNFDLLLLLLLVAAVSKDHWSKVTGTHGGLHSGRRPHAPTSRFIMCMQFYSIFWVL